MNNNPTVTTSTTTTIGMMISRMFGCLFLGIGIINIGWGNDPGFGVFVALLSLVYFLPIDKLLTKMTGRSFRGSGLVKVLLGIFLLWASLGVGELFAKIDLMMKQLH